MQYKNLADEIERLRSGQMLSLLEMAELTRVSYVTLQRILDGVTKNVQSSTLRNIAKAFNCEIDIDGDKIYFIEKHTIKENQTAYTVRKEEKEFIDALNGLPEKTRARVMRIIEEIVKLRED